MNFQRVVNNQTLNVRSPEQIAALDIGQIAIEATLGYSNLDTIRPNVSPEAWKGTQEVQEGGGILSFACVSDRSQSSSKYEYVLNDGVIALKARAPINIFGYQLVPNSACLFVPGIPHQIAEVNLARDGSFESVDIIVPLAIAKTLLAPSPSCLTLDVLHRQWVDVEPASSFLELTAVVELEQNEAVIVSPSGTGTLLTTDYFNKDGEPCVLAQREKISCIQTALCCKSLAIVLKTPNYQVLIRGMEEKALLELLKSTLIALGAAGEDLSLSCMEIIDNAWLRRYFKSKNQAEIDAMKETIVSTVNQTGMQIKSYEEENISWNLVSGEKSPSLNEPWREWKWMDTIE